MPSNPRESAVFQLVRSNHEQAEQGHKRLRDDYRELEVRMDAAEALLSEHTFAIGALKTASPDLSRMTLSPGIVIGIVTAIVSIVGGQVASTWGLRSDIRDINTHMNAQADTDKSLRTLQDERAVGLRNAVDEINKKQEQQQLEIQSLRETILNQRRTR